MMRSKFFQLSFVLLRFSPDSSVSSILQFLGSVLRSILDEDDFSFPSRCTSVSSHVELDLPIDWPSVIVVFEIQARVMTQIVRILNFFVLNSGSPYSAQLSITSMN